MRILYLTQWYTPEAVFVVPELAQTLQSLGHTVTVLTGFPNYPSGKLYPGYHIRHWQKETIDGIPVIRLPLFPDHSKSAIRRALNMLSFAASATILGPWLAPRADVIYVTYPPVTVGGPAWLLSRLWGVPFACEINDMWPDTLRATGFVSNERILNLVGWFAGWTYRRAAAIRVITPGFRANLIDKGVPSSRIHMIPVWANTDLVQPLKPDPDLARQLGLDGHFNVMYAGSLGPAQDLDTVLDAADLLRDMPDIQFVFVGDGIELPRLIEIVKSRQLNSVSFLGHYPVQAMSGLYALADVLLLHLRDDPLFRITIPSKTYAYLASGKPVLAAVEGDAAEVVRSTGAGLPCPPSNPRMLADTVRRFYAMPPAERDRMGQNGRSAVYQSNDREYLVGQIAEMLDAVAKEFKARQRNAD